VSCDSIMHYIVVHLCSAFAVHAATWGAWDEPRPRREKSIVWIKWIGTHGEYDNIDVKTVSYEKPKTPAK